MTSYRSAFFFFSSLVVHLSFFISFLCFLSLIFIGNGLSNFMFGLLFDRYVGGVEEVVGMNEMGRLGRLLRAARVERGVGWKACEGCGGARFVPCLECGGSCKLILKGDIIKERCPKCNENGLIHCPACH